MNPVELLQAWHAQRPEKKAQKLRFEFAVDSQRKSARLDVESDAALGRATVWENGMCDIEVIDAEEGHQLVYLHIEVSTEDDLHEGLEQMIKQMLAGSHP